MTKLKIVQLSNKETDPLRTVSREIKQSEWGSEELLAQINDMKETLLDIPDGVALASPQVGINKRLFVIADRAFEPEAKWKPTVFANPRIIKASKKSAEMHEGCLSVRYVYGKTVRHINVTVEAYNEYGIKFTYEATGLIAHIIQHEIDHLDATLFVDHGYDFEEYTQEDIDNNLKKK